MAEELRGNSFQVAIVGAGPAGLLLANLLHQANVAFYLFESRTREQLLQQQGRSLDLHPASGLAALEAGGFKPAVLAHARQIGNGVTLTDKAMRTWFSFRGGLRNPHVDREDLIRILVKALPDSCFHWDSRLEQVLDDNTLVLRDGSKHSGFDFVVGADGAWSRVRASLSPQKPFYTGIAGQTFVVKNISEAYNKSEILGALPKTGSLFSFSDHKAFIVHLMSKDRASVTLFQCQSEDQATTPEKLSSSYSDWDPRFQALLGLVDPESAEAWRLHRLPTDFSFTPNPSRTVIGDAASLRSPFGGEGVNLALLDAMELSRALIHAAHMSEKCDAASILRDSISEFQRAMLERGHRAQQLALDMQVAMMDAELAPRRTIAGWVMLRANYDLKGQWRLALPFLSVGVHLYYAFLRAIR